jgi:hypothetical protein
MRFIERTIYAKINGKMMDNYGKKFKIYSWIHTGCICLYALLIAMSPSINLDLDFLEFL